MEQHSSLSTTRRAVLAILASALAPRTQAQQRERMRRIGMLIGVPLDDPITRPAKDALIGELKHLGRTEGENYRLDIRSANGGGAPGFRAGAAELVALSPDLIVGVTPGAATDFKDASAATPILFVIMDDPIGRGLVASIPQPGGNITGVTDVDPRIGGKWVQLLKQIVPNIEQIALVHNPEASGTFDA